jgi:hypothetical protein
MSGRRLPYGLGIRSVLGGPSGQSWSWFLPSEDELMAMYTELHSNGLGSFESATYWSSTERMYFGLSFARRISFVDGVVGYTGKLNTDFNVRPCRTFTAALGAYSLRDTGPAGGLIFYISGTTYFESYSSDISVGYIWSDVLDEIGASAQGSAIGTGSTNTLAIISQVGHTVSAAKLCNDFSV